MHLPLQKVIKEILIDTMRALSQACRHILKLFAMATDTESTQVLLIFLFVAVSRVAFALKSKHPKDQDGAAGAPNSLMWMSLDDWVSKRMPCTNLLGHRKLIASKRLPKKREPIASKEKR